MYSEFALLGEAGAGEAAYSTSGRGGIAASCLHAAKSVWVSSSCMGAGKACWIFAYASVCLFPADVESGWNQGGGGVAGPGVVKGGGGVELTDAVACSALILVCAR